MWGARVLAVGWSGIFAAVMAWYANPFWLLGLVLGVLRSTLMLLAGLVALAIASSTYLVIGRELPDDEGNVTRITMIRLLPGFYVWMASLATLPLAALFSRKQT
jgi:hypothetical protein